MPGPEASRRKGECRGVHAVQFGRSWDSCDRFSSWIRQDIDDLEQAIRGDSRFASRGVRSP